MENFEPKQKGVKEKNLYILHLDTTRIIIIGSVVIGIITAAFLFGMSFMKDDKRSPKDFAVSGTEFNEMKTADMLSKDAPPVNNEKEGDGTDEKTIPDPGVKPGGVAGESDKTHETREIASAKDISKHEKDDVLTGENIREIIPPAVNRHKTAARHKKPNKSEVARTEKAHKNPAREVANNKETRVKGNRNGVYEVSRDTGEKRYSESYSIQVASYDLQSKAENERSLLKTKKYDVYIDKSQVNGKNYFRVRVGPVHSIKEASRLLNEIQSESRYSGSYMVKE